MRRPHQLLTLFITLLSTLSIYAQESAAIKGKVEKFRSHSPIAFANVLIENQSTLDFVTGGVSDSVGLFELNDLKAGTYRLVISFLGFESDTLENIAYDALSTLVLNTFRLKRHKTQLEELNIVGERPMIIQSAGKTTLNVNEAMSGSGESAMELLKYLPSASSDEEDNVLLRGAPATIMIDGVETDLANALDALPIGMIDKVEVITNPSAKYSSQNGSGIINIILKTDKKKGANGRVNAAIGTPQRTQIGGNIMLNHKRWTSFSNADLNRYNDELAAESERRSINNATASIMYSTTHTDKTFQKLNLRQGVKYQIDENSSIRIDGTYRFDKYEGDGIGEMKKINNDSSFVSHNQNTAEYGSDLHYWSSALDYRKSFKDKSQLSVVGKYEGQNKQSPYNKRINYYNTTTGETKNNYLIQTRSNPEYITSFRLQADYEKDLNQEMKLESGFLLLNRNSEAESDFVKTRINSTDTSYSAIADSSQIYDYQVVEMAPSAYTMFVFENDDWSLAAGLRYEYVHYNSSTKDSSITTDHHNFLPSLQVSRKLNDKFTIGIAATMRSKMPKYQQLSPIEVYNGLYSKSVGNPNLKPERITSLEFNLRRQLEKHNISSALFYKRFENMIGRQQYYVTKEDRELLVKQYGNIGQVHQYGLDININSRLPYNIKLKTNLLVMGQNINSEVQGVPREVDDFAWSAKIVADQTLFKNLRWQLSTGYTSPTKNINGKRYNIFYTNLGFSQKILDKKGTVGIQFNDVFNTIDKEFLNNSSVKYEQYAYSKAITQKVLLSFSYRFNTMAKK